MKRCPSVKITHDATNQKILSLLLLRGGIAQGVPYTATIIDLFCFSSEF
jgi:hypothetical protein